MSFEQIVQVGRDKIVRNKFELGRSLPAVTKDPVDPEDLPRQQYFDSLDCFVRVFADELFQGAEPSSQWLEEVDIQSIKLKFSDDEDAGYMLEINANVRRQGKKAIALKIPFMPWKEVQGATEQLVEQVCAEASIYLSRTPAKTQMALEV